MTKNEALDKVKKIVDNDKRKTILEKRLTRLEKMMAEDDRDIKVDDNSYRICRDILNHYGATDWIGESDIDEYLDIYYSDMSDEDRWLIHDNMENLVGVDPYRSLQDDDDDWDEDDEDFESRKCQAKRVRSESTKRSLVSRYKK